MAKGISPTSRTLEYLRSQGYEAGTVERWIRNPKHPAGGFRKDLLGFIDIIALTENGITGIQSCGQAFAEHDRKIKEEPMALKWLEKGGHIMLIGWRKILKNRGGKLRVWSPRIKEYTLEDFEYENI